MDEGDTLEGLAKMYHLPFEKLLAANKGAPTSAHISDSVTDVFAVGGATVCLGCGEAGLLPCGHSMLSCPLRLWEHLLSIGKHENLGRCHPCSSHLGRPRQLSACLTRAMLFWLRCAVI